MLSSVLGAAFSLPLQLRELGVWAPLRGVDTEARGTVASPQAPWAELSVPCSPCPPAQAGPETAAVAPCAFPQ